MIALLVDSLSRSDDFLSSHVRLVIRGDCIKRSCIRSLVLCSHLLALLVVCLFFFFVAPDPITSNVSTVIVPATGFSSRCCVDLALVIGMLIDHCGSCAGRRGVAHPFQS